ncbi:hypothetical protein BH10ACI4_BH10ACI4_29840 [soil metagenome]
MASQPMQLVFVFFVGLGGLFVVVAGLVHQGKFERVDRNDLKVSATFVALYGLAFFYLIRVHNDRVVAFRANNSHVQSLLGNFTCADLYYPDTACAWLFLTAIRRYVKLTIIEAVQFPQEEDSRDY